MIFKWIYMFFSGYITVIIEGFFVERFINICRSNNIVLLDIERENNTYLKIKILKSDFKDIRHIAKKTKCKIKIAGKAGVPFLVNKYRKRKIFAIAILVIAIFIFVSTKFIWNIEVTGNEKITKEEILEIVSEYGINKGVLKNKINTDKISNLIRLERDDISWIGITLKGTNVIINIKESIEIPEVINKDEVCNIIANQDAKISKIVVHSGTARVSVGDEVKKGDLLVEGVMEGVHLGNRSVHADAIVTGLIYVEKEKKEEFMQTKKTETGNREIKREICMNNFKINLNKKLSNFENYDTIYSSHRIKLFSNFYLPIEVRKTEYKEIQSELVEYSESELKDKIESELEDELEKENNISNYENKTKNIETILEQDGLVVKLIYEIKEEIGTKVKIN